MIVVLGAGESGTGAALLARAKGLDVFVSERGTVADKYRERLEAAGIPFEEGGHTEARVLAADEVVKSPGIPDTVPLVRTLDERGVPVVDELAFAARYTRATLIGITGSNGKTTTTLLAHHLLKSAGLNVGLAGNVGQSLAQQVIDDVHDYYVLEMSSFQLDRIGQLRPHVAVLLNISPDHLDRYDHQFENYVAAKFRITLNQTADDFFVSYNEDPTLKEERARRRLLPQHLPISLCEHPIQGAFLDREVMHVRFRKVDWVFPCGLLPLPGRHNQVNTGAALLIAAILGADEAGVRAGLDTFRGAPHRLESVGTVGGVRFVNDSKATNVDAVRYALDATAAPVVWLAGGVDKGNDYGEIRDLVRDRVRALVCIGKDDEALRRAFGNGELDIVEAADMGDAVRRAWALADGEGTVLLSPACASFDRFRNYEDRGDQFKAAVRSLREEAGV
ncbi:MAG: UDP-N-acetylmuramoyl-L-alanine--D-glutamate ligase [Catalinimonas sp.]